MTFMSISTRLDEAFETVKDAVREAGDYAREWYGKTQLGFKSVDIDGIEGVKEYIAKAITFVDIDCQRKILSRLRDGGFHLDTSVLAEENSSEVFMFADQAQAPFRFVVDSIDGSWNYGMAHAQSREELTEKLRKIGKEKLIGDSRFYGVSAGLQDMTDPQRSFVFAVVYLPQLGEFYVAMKGKGAQKNDAPLHISGADQFSPNLPICINSKADFAKEHLTNWKQPNCTTYSVTGVADGKHAAFLARNTNLHDFGPSSLIVAEAGGYNSDGQGNPMHHSAVDERNMLPYYIAAASPKIACELIHHAHLP